MRNPLDLAFDSSMFDVMKTLRRKRTIFLPLIFITLSSCCLLSCEILQGSNPISTRSAQLPEPGEFIAVEVGPGFVFKAEPVYPPAALAAGIEATVWVKALIGKGGDVLDAIVARASGASEWGFEDSAIEAALRCKFTPAIQNGEPVAIWVTFAYEFKLPG